MKDSLPRFASIAAAVKLTHDKGSKILATKMSAMNAMSLTTWPEIVLFIITDKEKKISDSQSTTYIVSDVMNWAIWHNPV